MSKRLTASTGPGLAKPERIATVLEQEIRSCLLTFGDRLQSENELVQRFSVSRNTVRKALEELSNRDLITTKVGIGSFVAFNGKTIDDARGWSRALADVGAAVETRVLRLEIVEDEALRVRFALENKAFIALDRVRILIDSRRPISIERSRLPLSGELEDVPLRGLREGSLNETLRAVGLVPDHGEEWADIELLNAEDAAVLECEAGTAFMRTRRQTYTADDRLIEFVTSLLNPSVFALHLEF